MVANGDAIGLASRQCFLFGPGVEPPRLTADTTLIILTLQWHNSGAVWVGGPTSYWAGVPTSGVVYRV